MDGDLVMPDLGEFYMIMLTATHAIEQARNKFVKVNKVVGCRRDGNTVSVLLVWRDMFAVSRRRYGLYKFTPGECNLVWAGEDAPTFEEMHDYFKTVSKGS